MKNNKFSDFLSKSFGKDKDDRSHAIAMTIIYFSIIAVLVLFIKLNPVNLSNEKNNIDDSQNNTTSSIVKPKDDSEEDSREVKDFSTVDSSINYSFSYKITYDGNMEVFLGKKIGGKEKFTYIFGDVQEEYAYINDNFLMLGDDNIYHIADDFDSFYKYCDADSLIIIADDKVPLEPTENVIINANNSEIASTFSETLKNDNNGNNTIEFVIKNEQIVGFKLDFSNYISSLYDSEHSLLIDIEYANIGTTEDFKILFN